MNDAVRVLTVLACCINIGIVGALYSRRVGRMFVPKLWMRMLMGAKVLWLAAGAFAAGELIGDPVVSWITPMFAASALIDLVALCGLYVWYGSPAGRAHAARVLSE